MHIATSGYDVAFDDAVCDAVANGVSDVDQPAHFVEDLISMFVLDLNGLEKLESSRGELSTSSSL
jgi:hypothetical protein